MHRSSGQMGLAEAWLDPSLGRNERLDRIAGLIDWAAIERLVAGVHGAPEGRKAFPPLVMVKALLLQQWYGLSDPRLEEALSDALSFRRFVGLGLDDGTPDHSTVSRFRAALRDKKLDEALFVEIERQLDGRGLILKRGTLMDATVVEAQARKPSYEQGAGTKSAVDADADWTRKGGKSHYGYKAHIGVDEGSGLIRRVILTPGLSEISCVGHDDESEGEIAWHDANRLLFPISCLTNFWPARMPRRHSTRTVFWMN